VKRRQLKDIGLGLPPDFLNARCVSTFHIVYPQRVGRSPVPIVAREFPGLPRELALNRSVFRANFRLNPMSIPASVTRCSQDLVSLLFCES
jgi:hypothetical protein